MQLRSWIARVVIINIRKIHREASLPVLAFA